MSYICIIIKKTKKMETSKPVKIKIDLLNFLSKIEESKVSTLSNKTQSQTEGMIHQAQLWGINP